LLQALLADMHADAGATFDDGGHPPHDLTGPAQLREHLEFLQDGGDALPGDPALIAAAIGGMLAMLAYALLPADPDAPAPAGQAAYSDAQILGTLTDLLSHGLAGPAARPPVPR
jgi:hypothetical protein